MFLDCGSADTVVYNSTCKNCQLNNHTAFDSRQSKSFKSTSVSFSTQYGDGTTLRGVLGNDYVNVTQSLRTPPTQILAVIDSRTGGSDTHRWDGIMGIGPDHLSFVEGNVTPLSNLVKNGELAQPLVGIALVKQDKLTGAPGGGEYRWGELNQNYILGDVVYTPVSSSYFWGTQMNGIFVNGEQMLSTSDYRRALFDTGTTLVYTSDAAAKRIHGEIAGAQFDDQRGFWYVPCDATGAPNVFFEIGGVRRGVPASDIAFRPSSTGNGLCMSGIQGGSDQYTLLGAVFIKNQCKPVIHTKTEVPSGVTSYLLLHRPGLELRQCNKLQSICRPGCPERCWCDSVRLAGSFEEAVPLGLRYGKRNGLFDYRISPM